MELHHSQHVNVLACDTDVFIGDTPADLNQYLDTATASQVQSWFKVWKPFVLSRVKSGATDLLLQGVKTITTYLLPTYI
jgi:hypothetical protein